jgi:peptidylprolyl isomerase
MKRAVVPTALAMAMAMATQASVSCQRAAPPAEGFVDRSHPAPSDVGNAPSDAQVRPSGVRTRVLKPGTGTQHPDAADLIEVFYTGWRRSGGFFEGTAPNQRIRLDRKEIVPGLDEGVGLMVEGEKRRFWIPYPLAYGARPNHVNAPKEDMTYDVELLQIVPLPPTPPAPELVAAPRNARRTKSGLRYVYLKQGKGTAHAGGQSFVRLQESMWTPDGRLFFTSLRHADVVRWPVADLIPGIEEAVKLMVPGDRLRLWLPGKLAYGEKAPGETSLPFAPPLGPIVVEVELFGVVDN